MFLSLYQFFSELKTARVNLLLLGVLCTMPKAVFSQSSFSRLTDADQPNPVIEQIIDYGKQFLGKPYRYKTGVPWPLDCSGFLSYIFLQNGLNIPKSSGSISTCTERIDFAEVRKGDLLFFKGRNIYENRVGHVTIVTDTSGDKLKMMHSCSRGILIEDYPAYYYPERFLFAGRVKNFCLPEKKVSDIQLNVSTESKRSSVSSEPNAGKKQKDTLTLVAVGDMMLGTNYPSSSYLPPADGKELLKPMESVIQEADITFGNLEGVLLSGEGPVKKCQNPAVCYAFKSPEHYAGYLKNAGFDVLSLANNHVGDFGDTGRINTVKTLEEYGIPFAGLEKYPYSVFTLDGITYGFCAFAPNTGTVKLNDYENARQIIRYLDSTAQIVIVSFHGGAEGPDYARITKNNELFLGENRGNPYEFARMAIDAGADIILGHGPHVPRAVDIYKNRFIAYSLGNFCTYGRFNLTGPKGLAPILKVKMTGEGEFLEAEIISAKQEGEGGPLPDPSQAAFLEIKRLTLLDFPESPLRFTDEGKILLSR